MLGIGEAFPKFEANACVRQRGDAPFQPVTQVSFPGQWVVYFFWPRDFTPVCATEVSAFAALAAEFRNRDAQIVGVSGDSEFVHMAWSQNADQPDELPFPFVADVKRTLTAALGVLDPIEFVPRRATYLVDPSGVIRHVSVNDYSVGRNPSEILRVLDALQTDDLCPSNWEKGAATIARNQAASGAVPHYKIPLKPVGQVNGSLERNH